MIEALRGLGYTPATAVADIIDNSIAAKATQVKVDFFWAGAQSHITIVDNGSGMSDQTLEKAMRLGDRSPTERRSSDDLGRFGLGLKTASFSQSRCLTVATKFEGRVSCLRWDLDVLAASPDDAWYLLEGPADGSEKILDALDTVSTGTLVLWERMNGILTPGFEQQDFLDLIDDVERHLGMVFQRYIEGILPKLKILLNGRPIGSWDPFLSDHSATWKSPVARLPSEGSIIEAQAFVLPHKDKLDQREWELAAGPEGWTAQQGFYVYRNRRLVVSGSWLGLGQGRSWNKEEAHRLARIRLDIPNSIDQDWQIDIRKSTARPPASLRQHLTQLAEDARARARRVFAHRGQLIRGIGQLPLAQAWLATRSSTGMRYRIDPEHPAIRTVLDDAGPILPQVRAMLRVIEETIPVQRIWLDTAEARETPQTGFVGVNPAEIRPILETMYRSLVLRRGLSPALAREQLLRTEPFHNYPDLVADLPDDPGTSEQRE